MGPIFAVGSNLIQMLMVIFGGIFRKKIVHSALFGLVSHNDPRIFRHSFIAQLKRKGLLRVCFLG